MVLNIISSQLLVLGCCVYVFSASSLFVWICNWVACNPSASLDDEGGRTVCRGSAAAGQPWCGSPPGRRAETRYAQYG